MLDSAAPATLVLDRGRRWTVTVLNVGLACCAVEAVVAALDPVTGVVPYAGPDRDAQVLLVSGTVTAKLGPLVQELHARLPGPVKVVAFGACASSGGPYWDSYSVVSGVDQLLPVDLYVPGCPPRPEALLAALDELAGGGATGARSGGAGSVRAGSVVAGSVGARSGSARSVGAGRPGDGLVSPTGGAVGPVDLRARSLP